MQFLTYCDGGHPVGAIAKHMRCSESTVKRIKAELLEMDLIEETVLLGRRGRPRALTLTSQGHGAVRYGLLEFRSVLNAYAPTVAEMEAIRRSRREAISGHIRSKPLERDRSAQRPLEPL